MLDEVKKRSSLPSSISTFSPIHLEFTLYHCLCNFFKMIEKNHKILIISKTCMFIITGGKPDLPDVILNLREIFCI